MASILRVNTLTDASSNNSIATSVLFSGTAKVWSTCSADGTSVLDSFNVSGIADTATGKQTISFANDFSDANYCSNMSNTGGTTKFIGTTTTTASSLLVYGFNADDSGFSDTQIATQINGDLA